LTQDESEQILWLVTIASASAQPDVVSIRFRLQYPDVETFVAKYAVNISAGGIFIASMDPPPVGVIVRFELSIAGGQPILRGEGEVVWTVAFDPMQPMATCGMSIRFQRVDAEGQLLIQRVLAYQAAHPEQFVKDAPDPYASVAYRPQPPSYVPAPAPSARSPVTTHTTTPEPAASSGSSQSSRVTPTAPAADVDGELADLLKPRAASAVTPADASRKLAELLDRRLRPSRT
jgi:molecular chaperone DnaK